MTGIWSRLFRRNRDEAIDDVDTVPISGDQFAAPRMVKQADWRQLPGFSASANDTAVRTRDAARLSAIRTRIGEGFTPAHPVARPEMFAGRSDLLRTIIRGIEYQHLHIVLYGDRGIGKTSLLHVLGGLARSARYHVEDVACSEDNDFSTMFRRVCANIPLLYHEDCDPTDERIEQGASFADVLPEGRLTVSQVSDLLTRVTGTRVLIVLDEFDRNQNEAFSRSIAELIKNLSDRSARVQIVIAGVASNLTELVTSIPSIRRNIMGIPVGRMDDNELSELIRLGEGVSGVTFSEAAHRRVVAMAAGSPYLATLIAHHAALNATDREATEVVLGDVDEAVSMAIEELEMRLSGESMAQIRSLTPAAAAAAGAVAREAMVFGGSVGANETEQALTTLPSTDRTALDRALNKLLIPVPGDTGGERRFAEDGVAHYLWMRAARAAL